MTTRFIADAPSALRRGGAGARLRFGSGPCVLGVVLVAASDHGICAILLGDDPGDLTQDLRGRFPHADLTEGGQALSGWIAAVIAFVDAPRIGLDLPLDIGGTPFQQQVWQALREIPPGSTATYAAIASRLGIPGAARAVARACAANPLAVAVPCHRVIGSSGDLSGYRWGVARKRALLEREAQAAER